MAAFITVTCALTKNHELVNLDNVTSIHPHKNKVGAVICFNVPATVVPWDAVVEGTYLETVEALDDIVKLIRDYTLIPGWNKISWQDKPWPKE